MAKLDLSKYKGFFFDLDGTLIDSAGVWNNADVELVNTYGTNNKAYLFADKERFFKEYKGNDLYLGWAQFLVDTYKMTGITAKQAQEWQVKFGTDFLRNIEYRIGADKLLISLKKNGAKIALVTLASDIVINTIKIENRKIKNSASFNNIFDEIITAKMITHRKPNPECFIKAMKLLKLKPKECLVFEDDLIGAMAAKNADMDVCIIYDKTSDENREKLIELTPYHINSFNDLLDN